MEIEVTKPNNRKLLIVVVVLAVLAISYFMISRIGSSANNSVQATIATQPKQSQVTPASNPVNANPQKIKLSDTKYWRYSYLISTGTIDSETQAAIAGFKLERAVLADGTQNIILKALQPEYHDQQYIVAPGQKLYFIETTMGDDHANQEFSMGDDAAVLVDVDGYITKT